MAQFPGFTPQVTDPAVLNEIVDRLILRGALGELPVNPVVNLTYQISEGNWVSDEAIASTTATDPAVGASLANTGPLTGGLYNIQVGWTASGPLVDWHALVKFRNETDSGNRDIFRVEMDADANSFRFFTRRKIIEGERVALSNETDLTLAGGVIITGFIAWTRLF